MAIQGRSVMQLMDDPMRDDDRVSGLDDRSLAFDLDSHAAFHHDYDLLGVMGVDHRARVGCERAVPDLDLSRAGTGYG
jgi:hypothetical protein